MKWYLFSQIIQIKQIMITWKLKKCGCKQASFNLDSHAKLIEISYALKIDVSVQ